MPPSLSHIDLGALVHSHCYVLDKQLTKYPDANKNKSIATDVCEYLYMGKQHKFKIIVERII